MARTRLVFRLACILLAVWLGLLGLSSWFPLAGSRRVASTLAQAALERLTQLDDHQLPAPQPDHGAVLQQESSPHHPSFPSDAFHASLARTCDVCAPDDAICRSIGEHNLARSVVTRGSGLRLRRFLRKLMRGEPVTIAVLGGSISNGHGLYLRNPGEPKLKHKPVFGRQLFDHLTKLYPNEGHVFHSGAVPNEGSAYFLYCSDLRLPPDPDLIFTEHNANDVRGLAAQNSYDALLRSLLSLPSKPAIINVHAPALVFSSMLLGGDTSLAVAAFYDVPTISLSSVLLPEIIRNPAGRQTYFGRPSEPGWPGGVDDRHMNRNGHTLLYHMLRIFVEREICALARSSAVALTVADQEAATPAFALPGAEDFDEIPRLSLTSRFNSSVDAVDPVRPPRLEDVSPDC